MKPWSYFLTRAWKPTPEKTFILGRHQDGLALGALRSGHRGLDAEVWDGPRCPELASSTYPKADREAGKPPPFHQARAHRLYKALLGQGFRLH
jgi:hypothetical protein